jgi:hypothetical protein
MKYTKEDIKTGMVFKSKQQEAKYKGYIITNPCNAYSKVEFSSLDVLNATWKDGSAFTMKDVLSHINEGKWLIIDTTPPTPENPSYEIF